jgi:methylase of polypeptide subunit release factors
MSKIDRNPELGQVWTPDEVAELMFQTAKKHLRSTTRVLDPACGPGTFSRIFSKYLPSETIIDCIDIDGRMVSETQKIHSELRIKGDVIEGDYLSGTVNGKYDLVVMNPPYIRHERLSKIQKSKLQTLAKNISGENLDGRSNLFSYFLLRGLADLKVGGVLVAIVYDSILHTNYGTQLLKIMQNHGSLVAVKKISAPFDGAIVDAVIVVFKRQTNQNRKINSVESTRELVQLGSLVDVRRGLSFTPRSKLVFSEASSVPNPHPIALRQSAMKNLTASGTHFIDLANSDLELKKLAKYSAPLLFNYYVRDNPRHLYNKNSILTSDNFYVIQPAFNFPPTAAWLLLNSKIYLDAIMREARNQGNGLNKLQVFEYKRARVPNWLKLTPEQIDNVRLAADALIEQDADIATIREIAEKISKGLDYVTSTET